MKYLKDWFSRKFTHPVQSFNCPECGKILKNENTYKVHMNTHIGMYVFDYYVSWLG